MQLTRDSSLGNLENYGGVAARAGYYFRGAASQTGDALRYVDNSNNVMSQITASGGAYFAGNVGIGTTSPTGKLEVVGGTYDTGLRVLSSLSAGLTLKSTAVGGHEINLLSGDGSAGTGAGGFGIYDTTDSKYRLIINSSGLMTIGHVGAATNAVQIMPAYSGTGELEAGAFIGGNLGTNSFNIIPDVSGGLGKVRIGYYSASNSNYQSALEVGGTAGTYSNLILMKSGGNVGIGTPSPTATLDVNANTIRLRSARTPASASASCNMGEIVWDTNYVYVCVATNTWKRSALATW